MARSNLVCCESRACERFWISLKIVFRSAMDLRQLAPSLAPLQLGVLKCEYFGLFPVTKDAENGASLVISGLSRILLAFLSPWGFFAVCDVLLRSDEITLFAELLPFWSLWWSYTTLSGCCLMPSLAVDFLLVLKFSLNSTVVLLILLFGLIIFLTDL